MPGAADTTSASPGTPLSSNLHLPETDVD
ncbi:hypothetical protein FRIGORI9N_220004 [Frigoribacterium sp. 9N]|nr:hypothetical protein FRIGORI9N_220004 [Frigoribacterium sp. 9N]